ncbi:MAG: hypothetical protein KAI96_03810, partial [Thermodesulfovibrionia bacterium]|nr:hypothetical protein [Thermodesulfovibrionia bacterium]
SRHESQRRTDVPTSLDSLRATGNIQFKKSESQEIKTYPIKDLSCYNVSIFFLLYSFRVRIFYDFE